MHIQKRDAGGLRHKILTNGQMDRRLCIGPISLHRSVRVTRDEGLMSELRTKRAPVRDGPTRSCGFGNEKRRRAPPATILKPTRQRMLPRRPRRRHAVLERRRRQGSQPGQHRAGECAGVEVGETKNTTLRPIFVLTGLDPVIHALLVRCRDTDTRITPGL